jgi:cytoskeleton protein RodZ
MSLGTDLKEARESKKITLEAVSKKTKIPVKFLEAIEENHWGDFPSHTFAKGFIRAYAKVVGLDPLLLTRQFNNEVAPKDVNIEAKNIESDLEKALGWRPVLDRPPVYKKKSEDGDLNLEIVEEGQEPPRFDPSFLKQRARSFRHKELLQMVGWVAAGLVVLVLLGMGIVWGWKAVSGAWAKRPKPPAVTASAPASSYETSKVADKYQHLIIKALDKSWVLVTTDDGRTRTEADLARGEVRTYRASNNFKIKLGNAGGVDVQFNGKPLGVLGPAGQVLEITLPNASFSAN